MANPLVQHSYPETNWLNDRESMVQRSASYSYVIGAGLRNEPRGTATSSRMEAQNQQWLPGNEMKQPSALVVGVKNSS